MSKKMEKQKKNVIQNKAVQVSCSNIFVIWHEAGLKNNVKVLVGFMCSNRSSKCAVPLKTEGALDSMFFTARSQHFQLQTN